MLTVQILILLIILLLSFLYIRWRSVKGYWAKLGVAHLPPNPLCGSLTFLLRKNVGIWMREIYDKFVCGGSRVKYVGIWFFWKPVLLVCDPDIARNVLVKDFGNFRNRNLASGSNDPIGALNVFTVNDPVWSQVRRRLTPVFTSSKLKQMQSYIRSKSKEVVQRIALEKGNRFDLRELLSDYTTDVIGTSAFGIASDATLTGDSSLRAVTKEFMKFSVYRGCCWTSIFFWPELVEIFGFTLFPKESVDFFRKIFKTIASQRKGDAASQHRDLLDALLQIQKEAEEQGEEFSDDLVIAQGAVFLQAGFDTSSVALTFMFNELAHAPRIQEKVYAELVEAKKRNGSEDFDTDQLEELTYFNCVIKETLRKYPAMGWLDRIAANDYVIDENLTIKAGTPVIVNTIGMHYDPEYFPDPYKFDPDRFLPENEINIKPYTYMPFGEGPRNCIGMRFAQISMRMVASAMMLNYKIEPYADTPVPNKCEIEKRGTLYLPGETINLEFKPRSYNHGN